jgi:hypothetical protein
MSVVGSYKIGKRNGIWWHDVNKFNENSTETGSAKLTG